jgi:hypothetical protein
LHDFGGRTDVRKINAEIVLLNISEAREELEEIEALARSGEELDVGDLVVMFGHAYHHMNFAWNARHVSDEKYRNLTDADFNEWGKFPTDILLYTAAEDD